MKRAIVGSLLGIAAAGVAARAYGQGHVIFSNYCWTDPPITNAATGEPLDGGWTVGLYYKLGSYVEPDDPGGLAVPTVVTNLLTNTATFWWFGPGYFGSDYGYGEAVVPDYTGGPITFEIVAYNGASYAASVGRGHSRSFVQTIALLGQPAPCFPDGVTSFGVWPCGLTRPPNIWQQPTSQTVPAGATATFSVGSWGPGYQWCFNGHAILGAMGNTLVLTNVQPTNAGAYSVLVSGYSCPGYQFVIYISSGAILTVLYTPVITAQPQGTVGYWGGTASFSVEADGVPAPSYLWYKDGSSISWATSSNLYLTNLALTDGGNYSVVVANSQGSVTSNPALLIVNPAGVTIGLHPFLTITGVVGKSFGIEYTTQVSQTNPWIALTNFALTQPVQEWIDTSVDTTSGTNRSRFYRVVPIP